MWIYDGAGAGGLLQGLTDYSIEINRHAPIITVCPLSMHVDP